MSSSAASLYFMFTAQGLYASPEIIVMTKVEKIIMAVLIFLIVGTVVFWNDVRSVFSNNKDEVVDEGFDQKKKDKKDKKDKSDKKKDDKDEASIYHLAPQNITV